MATAIKNPVFLFASVGILFLSFFRLGHYSLWDDEANTALIAQGVARTGDTSALIGDNIVAFRNGSELSGLKARYVSPLQYYLAAPFVHNATDAFSARFPFALCGVIALILLLFRISTFEKNSSHIFFWTLAILGNVSLFLYLRQCRYYAPVILFSILSADAYFFWKPGIRRAFFLGIFLAFTFCSNYLNGVALIGVLGIEMGLHSSKRLKISEIGFLLIPLVLISVPVFLIWNPLFKDVVNLGGTVFNWSDKWTLFLWNWRDLNRAELINLPILFFSILAVFRKSMFPIFRTFLALFVYISIISLLSPQPVQYTNVADIRYLVPVTFFSIFILCQFFGIIFSKNKWVAVFLSLVVFFTNFSNSAFGYLFPIQSTSLLRINEIFSSPRDPYTVTVEFLKSLDKKPKSIVVIPGYMTYPLMYHFPETHYYWQMNANRKIDFPSLADWNFYGSQVPDSILAFGPVQNQQYLNIQDTAEAIGGLYQKKLVLNIFWHDTYRPELFWRSFREISINNPDIDGILFLENEKK